MFSSLVTGWFFQDVRGWPGARGGAVAGALGWGGWGWDCCWANGEVEFADPALLNGVDDCCCAPPNGDVCCAGAEGLPNAEPVASTLR